MNRGRAERIAVRIALVVGAILVVLVVLEITLRWRPTLLGQAFANGARLLMAPVTQGRQLEILRPIAARYRIDLVDTSPLYAGPSFLPNDGHFTPQGARTMADLIAAEIARRPPSR